MTPAERMKLLINSWLKSGRTCPADMQADIEAAIVAAVEETRQAWLVMVDEVISDHLRHDGRMEWDIADHIMKAIRARSEAKEEGNEQKT